MKVKPASIIALQQEVSQLTVAVSGINFAVMCLVSMVLIRLAIPADPTEPGTWLADPGNRRSVYFALHLVPFMGLSFLWFMAVLRIRIGTDVGRIESTVTAAAATAEAPCGSVTCTRAVSVVEPG